MATRPATAPEAAPTAVGLPSLIFSMTIQPMMAAAVAPSVLITMRPTDESSVPSSENVPSAPALKPNQPNHRMAAPSITSGTLCGLWMPFWNPTRLPSTRARASAAAPALMCTAVPPA